MDVFELHRDLIKDYAAYTRNFIRIGDQRIQKTVENEIEKGLLWPEPLLQLNPIFEPGATIESLVAAYVLHDECERIFRIKRYDNDFCKTLRLHRHQEEAIRVAANGESYVLTTGTGSGNLCLNQCSPSCASWLTPISTTSTTCGTLSSTSDVELHPKTPIG